MPEALLRAWLADPRAPRLCLVPELPPVRLPGVTVLSLAGLGVPGAVWSLANTLGVAARTPAELLTALLSEGRRRTLALPGLGDADDPKGLAELILSLADLGCLRLLVESPDPLTPRLSQGPAILLEELERAHGPEDDDLTSLMDDVPVPGESVAPLRRAVPPPASPAAPVRVPVGAGPAVPGGEGQPSAEGVTPGSGELAPSASSVAPVAPVRGTSAASAVTVEQDPRSSLPGARRPEDLGEGLDLGAAGAVCAADPRYVTVAYDREAAAYGGLGPAWLRAGQAVVRDVPAGVRAFALLTALGEDADPGLRAELTALAADEPWWLVAARVRGDRAPAWPGAAAALAVDGDGRLLLADDLGTVHVLDALDAAPAAEAVTTAVRRPRSLAALDDGTLLLLDERGRLRSERGPGSWLTRAVADTLAVHPGTALTTADGAVLVGDRMGSVHAFGIDGVHQAALHAGRVTALAYVAGPSPLACSGGADGAVRTWRPGCTPRPAPVAERACAVVALAAAPGPDGPLLLVAWADGLVELHRPGGPAPVPFRPGPPVRAVALVPDGTAVVGTDESLILLRTG
ncbi:hypothetical protein ABZO31_26415 [Streptomyces sp. HUAS MG47]|uniref:hypothetical protein n=1 Tax=Streptomyces solicamelliae TaxID=3231716 RepID=UPI0038782B8B